MHLARKRRIHERHGGRCADCGDLVPVNGPGVVYDHFIQLAIDGPEEDRNVDCLCFTCNKKKTAEDARVRAKIKRLRGETGNSSKPKRAIPSPGFRKDITKKFDGRIVPRTPKSRGIDRRDR